MLPDLRGANTSGRDRNIKRSSDVIMVGLWIRPGRTSRISLYAEQKGAHKVAQFSSATRQEKMQEGVGHTAWEVEGKCRRVRKSAGLTGPLPGCGCHRVARTLIWEKLQPPYFFTSLLLQSGSY